MITYPGLPGPELSQSPDQRLWLLRELQESFEKAAHHAPLLFIVDGLQWADAATASTLATLAKTWTIQPGGAVHAKSGRFTLRDTTTGSVITCVPLTGFPLAARGRLKSGSGLPGSRAGSLRAASFGHCAGSAGPLFTLRAGGLPWHMNLSFYNAAKGGVQGTIRHLHLTLRALAARP
jgi:hypothetical protein